MRKCSYLWIQVPIRWSALSLQSKGTLVRYLLDIFFPKQCVGRRGPFEKLTRSLDLSSLEYLFWGYLMNYVSMKKKEKKKKPKKKIFHKMGNFNRYKSVKGKKNINVKHISTYFLL